MTADRTSRHTEPDVEDGNVGEEGRDAGHRLGRGARLADDLDVVLGLEQLGDATPHDLVVVEEEHGDGHRARLLRVVARS